jgi:hypothetical protein
LLSSGRHEPYQIYIARLSDYSLTGKFRNLRLAPIPEAFEELSCRVATCGNNNEIAFVVPPLGGWLAILSN